MTKELKPIYVCNQCELRNDQKPQGRHVQLDFVAKEPVKSCDGEYIPHYSLPNLEKYLEEKMKTAVMPHDSETYDTYEEILSDIRGIRVSKDPIKLIEERIKEIPDAQGVWNLENETFYSVKEDIQSLLALAREYEDKIKELEYEIADECASVDHLDPEKTINEIKAKIFPTNGK